METMMMSEMDKLMMTRHAMHDEAQFADMENLPAESFECFSEMPLNFEEMAAGLNKDLEQVYALTQTLNRYSKDYPEVCRRLEQMIKRLGSCCVTKTVLEQKGFEFPTLKDLNLKDLYCMVSFNFRKTRTAFNDSLRLKNCADMGLLDLECRLVDLAERLKTTEDKIRRINAGEVNVDRMLEQAKMFRGQKGIRRTDDPNDRRPFATKARALPFLGSAARQMIEKKKAAEKAMRGMNVRPFAEAPVFPPMQIEEVSVFPEEVPAESKMSGETGIIGKNRKQKTDLFGITPEEIDRMTRETWERVTGTPAPAPRGELRPARV